MRYAESIVDDDHARPWTDDPAADRGRRPSHPVQFGCLRPSPGLRGTILVLSSASPPPALPRPGGHLHAKSANPTSCSHGATAHHVLNASLTPLGGRFPSIFQRPLRFNLQIHYSILLGTQAMCSFAWINEIGSLCSLTKTAAVKGPP